MKILISISLIVLFVSCINQGDLKPIVPLYIIHANSSKVWVLDELWKGNTNTAPTLQNQKKAFIFFDNHNVYIQPYIYLGGHKGKKAKFSLKIDKEYKDTVFTLEYKNDVTLNFKLIKITQKSMRLLKIENKYERQRASSSEVWVLNTLPNPF